ncbi:MAG: FAD-dependent monooxygenase [Rubrobacter sp.]|nr:FAD-dependent monooxygenase [Rubrobacter sp.]
MTAHVAPDSRQAQAADEARKVEQTTCCVVGGSPGGVMLALLLARKRVDVTLLEAHPNFEREFRGDTIHPSVMELMDEQGLADCLLSVCHTEIHNLSFRTAAGSFTPVDFSRLKTRFPYITMMSQSSFLQFITEEAKRYQTFD